MTIAFDSHNCSQLNQSEHNLNENTNRRDSSSIEIRFQEDHYSPEAQLFESLLNRSDSSGSATDSNSMQARSATTNVNGLVSYFNQASAAFSSQSSSTLSSQLSALISRALTAGTQTTSSLNSLNMPGANSIHSFSLLIPGQANLNVSTQVLTSGVRALQLDSEDKKFQTWLNNHSNELSLALSDDLNTQVLVTVGAPA